MGYIIDEKEFTRLYNKFFKNIYFFVQSYTDHYPEDIVANTFIKVWHLRDSFESEIKVKAFLYIHTKNACLNQIRDNKTRPTDPLEETFDIKDIFHEALYADEKIEMLRAAINRLSKSRKRMILLRLEQKSHAEIADLLGLSLFTVYNTLQSLVHQLRVKLGGNPKVKGLRF